MDEREVQAQIGQMVEFIRKEAQEKASEIKAAAEEEYAIEKQHMTEAEISRIRNEFESKLSSMEIKKKIEYATQLNSEKLRVLQAREDALCAVVDDAHMKLAAMSKPGPAYEKLLIELIVQSFGTLGGDSPAIVHCRAVDLPVVQKVAPAAMSKFAAASGTKVEVTCVGDLAPPPTADLDVAFCSGGVIVTNSTGKIKSNNTLDARLAITRQAILPKLREELFGLVAKDR